MRAIASVQCSEPQSISVSSLDRTLDDDLDYARSHSFNSLTHSIAQSLTKVGRIPSQKEGDIYRDTRARSSPPPPPKT